LINGEKPVDGRVKLRRFSTQSHFTWQLVVERFRK